jgi:hypothetical protein
MAHPGRKVVTQLLGMSGGEVDFIRDTVKGERHSLGRVAAINVVNEQKLDALGHGNS